MSEHVTIKGGKKIENSIAEKTFARIAEIAMSEAGIVLSTAKVSMVKSRLTRRLRALSIPTFDEYLEYLTTQGRAAEMDNFISALTTNVSHFFRENHHFEYLAKDIIPVLQRKVEAGGKARIWSAGCSNGQEPYSIAMTILKHAPKLAEKNLKILATDIDPDVLKRAKSGEYFGTLTTGLSDELISKFFRKSHNGDEETLSINQNVKDLVHFRQLNLHSDWPMSGNFDLIFCRNVVIYFDEPTQVKLFRRFANILEPGGWLMLGHSERLSEQVLPVFENFGVTSYRTPGASPSTAAQLETNNDEEMS